METIQEIKQGITQAKEELTYAIHKDCAYGMEYLEEAIEVMKEELKEETNRLIK